MPETIDIEVVVQVDWERQTYEVLDDNVKRVIRMSVDSFQYLKIFGQSGNVEVCQLSSHQSETFHCCG